MDTSKNVVIVMCPATPTAKLSPTIPLPPSKFTSKLLFALPAILYSTLFALYCTFIVKDDIDSVTFLVRACMMGACTTLAWLATLPYRHMHIPFIVVQFIVAASWAVAGTEISHNRPATTLSTFDYIFHLISFVVQVVISFCSCLFAWDDGIRIKW